MGRNKKNTIPPEETKSFHFTMPRETWVLLKNASTINEITMSNVLVNLLETNRKKLLKE